MGKKARHRNRRAAALLAMMVVGLFETHEFYIGNATAGAAHLIALCAAALLSNSIGIQPALAFVAIFLCVKPCVEGIICALKTDAQFNEQYGPSGSGSPSPAPAASWTAGGHGRHHAERFEIPPPRLSHAQSLKEHLDRHALRCRIEGSWALRRVPPIRRKQHDHRSY